MLDDLSGGFADQVPEGARFVEGSVIRTAEAGMGTYRDAVGEREAASRAFLRSLFVVAEMRPGHPFTRQNLQSTRPGYGLLSKLHEENLGRRAWRDISRAMPLAWRLVTKECGQ